jgi:hypothetical protein
MSGSEVHRQDPLPLAQRWATKHRLVLAASPDEHSVARRGHQYTVTAPPSVVESSSWLEWLEHSQSMVWL